MFKIRTLLMNDFKELERLVSDNINLKALHTKSTTIKLLFIAQNIIPHNMRVLPSIHIAVEENKIVGFILLQCSSRPNNCWQINEVFVFDENRNSGIGEELLRYVLSVYGSYGIEHFLAEVDSENFPALSLFHQCGFRRYAKVHLYEKEISKEFVDSLPSLEKDFFIRTQTYSDLNEVLKVELSSIPPDLRPALGHSKNYFKKKENAVVLIDKSRDLIIGWGNVESFSNDNCSIELIITPGWTHLYEPFFNKIISSIDPLPKKIVVKAVDYITDLREVLNKSGFLPREVKELVVRTIWQKAKERKTKSAKFAVPRIAPT